MPVPAQIRLIAIISLALLAPQPATADRAWLDNPCCGYDGRGPQGYRPPPQYQPNPYRADPYRSGSYQADPYRPDHYRPDHYRPDPYRPNPYAQPRDRPVPPQGYSYPPNSYPPNAYKSYPPPASSGRTPYDRYPADPAYTDRPYRPPPVVVMPPVVVAPPQPSATIGRSPAEFVYWCDAPKGYYPNVITCDGPWREKSATSTR